jgi:hypothetical protein
MSVAYLSLAQAARVFPHEGDNHPHPAKITRAIQLGKPSKRRPGERIKLRAIHDGRRFLTTEAWISEYVAALAADRGAYAPVPGLQMRAQAARARLAAQGF